MTNELSILKIRQKIKKHWTQWHQEKKEAVKNRFFFRF